MTGPARTLPARPSLRHVKVEARRRVKSEEFPALYEAHLAIAREHGQPSWAGLKKLVCGQSQPQSRALSQLRWIISRFADADDPGWAAWMLRRTTACVRFVSRTTPSRSGTAHPCGRVGHPAAPPADRPPDLVTHAGPMLPCDGERGVFRVSALGAATLGQLAADITGSPYPGAVARLVSEPLGMTGSSFPSSWPRDSAVVGYTVSACRAA